MTEGSLFKAFFLQSQSTSKTELVELSSDRHVKIVTDKYAESKTSIRYLSEE